MLEGLWLVKFKNQENWGNGVVTLETQRILGGDSGFYYIGDYKTEHHKFNASIKVTQHEKGISSVFFPLTNITISFVDQDISSGLNNTILRGSVDENPALTIDVEFTKLTDLS